MTEGQTAIVTGVGPGLGAAIARRFASAGMKVAVSARNPAKIDAIAKSLPTRRAQGSSATPSTSRTKPRSWTILRLSRPIGARPTSSSSTPAATAGAAFYNNDKAVDGNIDGV
mgnify:CR=1 FL=1